MVNESAAVIAVVQGISVLEQLTLDIMGGGPSIASDGQGGVKWESRASP